MNKESDRELVQAAADGDKNAYGLLYDRYAPLVRAICYDHTHHLADAQDLAQDVFLRVYERLSQLRQPERFGPWLMGIARRRCQEWRRQKSRQRRRLGVLAARSADTGSTPGPAENGQLLRLVGTLPANERLALHAFYLRNESVEEARGALGLSRSG
ncbi:MAG: sigma-70 family RNA polymerase sigma factor, partial [Phycisphaerales bacterium]